jgi:hypothetical protein
MVPGVVSIIEGIQGAQGRTHNGQTGTGNRQYGDDAESSQVDSVGPESFTFLFEINYLVLSACYRMEMTTYI